MAPGTSLRNRFAVGILSLEPGAEAFSVGGAAISVADESHSFLADRLGIGACSDPKEFPDSGRRLRRRPDDPKTCGTGAQWHSQRYRLCRRQCCCLAREESKTDFAGPGIDRESLRFATAVCGKYLRSGYGCRDAVLLAESAGRHAGDSAGFKAGRNTADRRGKLQTRKNGSAAATGDEDTAIVQPGR